MSSVQIVRLLLAAWTLLIISVIRPARAQSSTPLSVEDALDVRTFVDLLPIALSPHGQWLAYTVKDNRRARRGDLETWARTGVRNVFTGSDVWISNVETGATRNLTSGRDDNFLPAWSPDGHYLAFLSNRDGSGQARLWIWDARKNELKRVSDVNVRAEQIAWTPDNRNIVVTTVPEALSLEGYVRRRVSGAAAQDWKRNRTETTSVLLYSANGADRQATQELPSSDPWNLNWALRDLVLVDVRSGKSNVIVRSQKIVKFLVSPDGSRVAYTNQKRFGKAGSQQILFDLVTVSLSTGAQRVVAADIPLGFAGEFSWSPKGTRLAYILSGPAERSNDCYVVDADGGNRKNLTSLPPSREWRHSETPLWDSAGERIYFVKDGALWRASLTQNEAMEVARVPARQIVQLIPKSEGRIWTPDGGTSAIVVTHDNLGKQDGFYKIHLQNGESAVLLEKRQCYTCRHVNEGQSTAVTADENHVVYFTEDAGHDADIWVSDASFEKPRRSTHLNSKFDKYVMGSARLVSWLGDDGEPLQGALLLPPGYQDGKRFPLIVWVYGSSSLSNHFDHFGFEGSGAFNMQLLATRGYAVLAPDSPQHPGVPLLDLAKTVLPGVNKVIEMGIADPDRLGVMGHSNGGYGTLGLIVQTNRFKAAMEADGMGDLVGSYGQMDGSGAAFGSSNLENGQNALGGTPWQVRDRYIENSPVFYLDRVETPLLIIHAAKDGAVAPFLGDQMFVGLRRLGKEVVYAKYEGEDHSPLYWSYANQMDFCNRMISWFEEHLETKQLRSGRSDAAR